MAEDKQKINSMLLFEIIGRPPEHLAATLNGIISQIDTENGTKVRSKKIAEPKKLDQKTGISNTQGGEFKIEESEFYSSFAEVELETENIETLVMLMFKYMPAHVEILSPENIRMSNGGWSEILSELIRRLHGYDEVARVMQVEKSVLENQLRALLNKNKVEVHPIDNSQEKGKKKAKSKTTPKSKTNSKKK